jgi:hypothetical protein
MNEQRVNRDVRAFVAHQFARQFEAGLEAGPAAQNLRAALPDEYHWAITETETTLAGRADSRATAQLTALLAAARAHGVSPERTYAAYDAAARDFRVGLAPALSGATTLGTYLAMLALLLVGVAVIYAVFVLPQFRAMYEAVGARLPPFTELVIGSAWLIVPVLAVLLAAVAVFLIGVAKLKTRLQALAPVRSLVARVPGMKAWARDHDVSLWMRYIALLLDAGATPETAATVATKLAGEPGHDHRPRLLSGAAALGRLREELARFLDEDAREAAARFEEPRNALVIGLRLLIYLVVSTYLVAMYLPIFKLGSII